MEAKLYYMRHDKTDTFSSMHDRTSEALWSGLFILYVQ